MDSSHPLNLWKALGGTFSDSDRSLKSCSSLDGPAKNDISHI